MQSSNQAKAPIKQRTGIVGIEKEIKDKQKATDASISQAFQDLSKLMTMAKDMVGLSKSISTKIREKQGEISEDDTIRFKSYLLSLGIDDPVTRDSFKSDNQYYRGLAKQLSEVMEQPICEVGGMMTLTDVYCRFNRARGLELVSPEDLLQACQVLDLLNLPLRLRKFESGVLVLQLENHNDETVVRATAEILRHKNGMTPTELSQELGIPVSLAVERLTTTEKYGFAARDDSLYGLRFYYNLFVHEDACIELYKGVKS